jgi:hypothetical protein
MTQTKISVFIALKPRTKENIRMTATFAFDGLKESTKTIPYLSKNHYRESPEDHRTTKDIPNSNVHSSVTLLY